MADVFLSYRNTPERRALVRRLATVLRAHEVSVWWDYGLEAGESFRDQILSELSCAQLVVPLWCAESVASKWVSMEAELGKDKLFPARFQKVSPPAAFEGIQAADLIGWDGSVDFPRLQAFVSQLCARLKRPGKAPVDLLEELGCLPLVAPLPDFNLPSPAASFGAAASIAWSRIETSTDPEDFKLLEEMFPATIEAFDSRRRRAVLERMGKSAGLEARPVSHFIESLVAETLLPLSQSDYETAAAALGCETAVLKAVVRIESRERGFDNGGRPIILFEPHIFSRQTNRRYDKSHTKISYSVWGKSPYPGTQDGRYAQLRTAYDLDAEAALRSTSWGLFQILGLNFNATGFASATDLVVFMAKSEINQLKVFAEYVKTNGIVDELRKKDWRGFAHVYNGPGQVEKYSKLIHNAYLELSALEGRR